MPQYDGMGNLEILVEGRPIFSSAKLNRFPEEGEIVGMLKQIIDFQDK